MVNQSRHGYICLMHYVTTFKKCSTEQRNFVKTHKMIYDSPSPSQSSIHTEFES